jgi:TPP-dependent pyruvate/acetoin dehydrogenase alpha subunit
MELYFGVTPLAMMHNMYGNALDSARGRQMPVHVSFVDPIKWVSISSPIGTHIPQAVGAARAFQQRGEDRVCLASFGDGGTSSLGFHSGMNFAGVWKAPVIFLCQNNGYAISCPSHEQTASESYAIKAEGYGMPGLKVDGNDLFAVRKATVEAVARARAGEGPTLIEAETFRMGGHSTADDPTRYVPAEEFEKWAKRDPIERFERYLERAGLWTAELRKETLAEAHAEINAAAKEAEKTPKPGLETIFSDVFAEVPAHIRRQGEAAFDLARRKGDAAAGDGEFPL